MESGIQAKFWGCLQCAFLVSGFLSFSNVALARPVPDETLSEESSRVLDRSERNFDIDGGARRGRNLFHSFREFGVEDGGSVYFLNPDGVENIFSRVTGGNRSDVRGILGVRGDANLFLMNPNGILFGPNARLDLNGSFVGTTANAIGFEDAGLFSATNPELPSNLLTVNPSAFLFNQFNASAPIINQSAAINPTNPQFIDGLRVDDGRSLLLVGGEIQLQQGSRLYASSGRIELGAISGNGLVGLTTQGNRLDLVFPDNLNLGTITALGSTIDTSGIQAFSTSGGEIEIQGSQVSLTNSSVSSFGFGSQANGAIVLRVNQLDLNRSIIGTGLRIAIESSLDSAGNVDIQAVDAINLSNQSQIGSLYIGTLDDGRSGSSGGVSITTNNLNLNGSGNGIVTVSLLGNGGNGELSIQANSINLDGGQLANSSLGRSSSGNIIISTNNLTIANGGNLLTTAFDPTLLNDSSIIDPSLYDPATVALVRELLVGVAPGSFGQGKSGDIQITARGNVQILTNASVTTSTTSQGQGGNISLVVNGDLTMQNGAAITAATFGAGRAGDIAVSADSIDLLGISVDRRTVSGIASESGLGSTGNAGDITVSSRLLNIQDGGSISTSSFGSGQAGALNVTARESATLSGTTQLANGQISFSRLASATSGSNRAGDIRFTTGRLTVQNGAAVTAATSGAGRAGDITVSADSIDLLGISVDRRTVSGIASESGLGSTGNAGDITVISRLLNIQDGAAISTSSFGSGQGGVLNVTARESATLSGAAQLANGQISSGRLSSTTSGSGGAGDIRFTTGRLTVQNGAAVTAATSGAGRAGDITVSADSIDLLSASSIGSESVLGSTGDAGNVTVSSRLLNIQDGASISTSSFGSGQGGVLNVTARESATLSGAGQFANGQISLSRLSSTTSGSGNGGELNLTTGTLRLQNAATISTTTFGQGRGGNLRVIATESTELSGAFTFSADQLFRSGLSTGAFGSGRAGDLDLRTGRLSIQNGALITGSTTSSGRAGDIRINADSIEMGGTDRAFTSQIGSQSEIDPVTGVGATGDAGDVNISARTLSLRDGAGISTTTFGQARGGALQVTATESIRLLGSATLDNGQVISSRLFTGTSGAGMAGNLQVTTDALRLLEGGQITASTTGAGRAGNIRVEADSILLSGASRGQPRRASGIGSNTFSQGENAGDAGNIRIFTGDLNIRDRAVISTATSGQGNAGRIRIQNSGDTVLSNDGNITSSVSSGAVGDGGKITLRTQSLSVDGAQIAAVVSRQFGNRDTSRPGGRGRGGDISITATDEIALTGITRDGFSGGILTLSERGANGSAGNISITADDLRIADGAIVVASTFNRGDGGNIEINASNFEAVNGGQVVTNTRDRGRAGSITLNADNVTLSGRDLNFQNRQERVRRYTQRPNITDRVSDVIVNQGSSSGLFANTSGSGRGGEIVVDSNNLDLTDRAAISTTSQSRGQAGNIGITATERLRAEDGTIATSATRSSGGDITLSGGSIRLFDNSDIRTNSRRTGGNITVNADSLVAFDDSDIIASAQRQGGDINFGNTITLFENYSPDSLQEQETGQLEGNSRADLNAAGERSGEISLPDTSFIQNSLSDLPSENLDAEQLIANSCIARRADGSTFLVTGRGSLPQRPGAEQPSEYPTGEVRGVEETESQGWQMRSEVVEPEGVYRLSDGRLVMSRPCQSSQ